MENKDIEKVNELFFKWRGWGIYKQVESKLG